MSSDIAGIGVEPEIDDICRADRAPLRDAGATVEEIAFDISDGQRPYQAWRGAWMVGPAIRQSRRGSRNSASI